MGRLYRELSNEELVSMDGLDTQYTLDNDYMILFVRIPRNVTSATNDLTAEMMVELPDQGEVLQLTRVKTDIHINYEVLTVISDYNVSVNTCIIAVQNI